MLLKVQLDSCHVKAVKADMVKRVATVTLEMTLDEQLLADQVSRQLAIMAVDYTLCRVTIEEQQLRLPGTSVTVMGLAPSGPTPPAVNEATGEILSGDDDDWLGDDPDDGQDE